MARECSTCHRAFQDKLSHCPYDGTVLKHSAKLIVDPLLHQIIDGKFRIEDKLGEGGMCNIYRATLFATKQPCAVKVLRPELIEDEPSVLRFRGEIRTAAMVNHPNIVEIIGSGESVDGTIYMIMELLEGETLKQAIQSKGPFSLDRLLRIVSQICDALDAAHSLGVIHRDLKPDNIMLLKHGREKDSIKVFDFGIAKMPTDRSITGELLPSRIVMGTPRYMSPEQCSGRAIDTRSDIYSLGIIVYEMIIGEPPFTDASAQVLLNKHTQEPIPSLNRRRPGLPSNVERAVMHALEKSPLKRPQLASDFADELDMAINADPSIAPEHFQPMIKSNLIPVVKQVSGTISIVEYTINKPPQESNKAFVSGQIKTELKKHWPYVLIGAIVLLLIVIVILFVLLLTSNPHG